MISMDSRERLEADALMLVDNLRVYGCNYAGDAEVEIIGMLDRQAAITEQALGDKSTIKYWVEQYDNVLDERDELQAKVDELTAERDECRIIASSTDGLTSDEPKQWFELSCGHTFKVYGLDVPIACPVCGRKVER